MKASIPCILAAAALAGCGTMVHTSAPTGQSEADVLRSWGPPTGRYPMPDGTTRLEYATGPYGRTTWMVDVDAGGKVVGARQVLNEANFQAFQGRAPGMTRDELLRTLGRPGEVRGERGGGQVWSWRYPTNDCLWFQSSIGADGIVRDGVVSIDPACDKRSRN
jgi:hypothetical protein